MNGNREQAIVRYLLNSQVPRLNIGAGRYCIDGWLNVDLEPKEDNVVFVDARKPLPFPDNSFRYVFSEHMLEHMEFREGMGMLRECYRIIIPGGRLRIATPDLKFLIDLYGESKTPLQRRYISWAIEKFLHDLDIANEAFVINNFFKSWGHKFIYDFRAISSALSCVGFADIARQEVGQSDDEMLRGIEQHGKGIGAEFNALETLVVEAVKPLPSQPE